MAARRHYKTIVGHLTEDPDTAPELVTRLDEATLHHLAAAVADEQRRRAVEAGNEDATIAEGFEHGFGRDGLAVDPWVVGPYLVCPGGLVGRNRAAHRCRFVSINDTWVWESHELVREDKRSTPGDDEGFRAVALVAVVDGTEVDVVRGRLRRGQHQVDHVVSYVIRRGELVEVAQRAVNGSHH